MDAPDARAARQRRNAGYLALNNVVAAAAGLAFWVVLARFAHLDPAVLGVGYATVALATTIGVLAKGGLDTALLRTVPSAHRQGARHLLALAIALGAGIAVLLAGLLASSLGLARGSLGLIGQGGGLLAAAIAVLLVVTWMQDAYFLALGSARWSFARNLVLAAVRLAVAWPLARLVDQPVPIAWLVALAASTVAGLVMARLSKPSIDPDPAKAGQDAKPLRPLFFSTAMQNAPGSVADFLPGLLLAPLVLALSGPRAAAYFGMAWTAASLLLLASAAIGRSALAELVHHPDRQRAILGQAVRQHLWLVVPAALAGALLAPFVLGILGPDYAAQGALPLSLLCASVVVVAPFYLYLNVLRAHGQTVPLAVLPMLQVGLLLLFTPLFEERFGLAGAALAWLGSNLPLGAHGLWRLLAETPHEEVRPSDRHHGRPAHLE